MEKKLELSQYEKCGDELAYQGAAIQVYKDYIKLPNGKPVTWDLIKHPGGAAVVPVDDDNNILMVRQYRNAVGRMTLEIPAGKLENGEERILCATRELEEETGYTSDNIVHLQDSVPAIGYSNEVVGLFYATNLKKSKQQLDEDEFINLVKVPVEEAVQMIYDGVIQDSKTAVAILLYYVKHYKK